MIYEQSALSETHVYKKASVSDPQRAVRKALTAMLLVNHQFAREYKESPGSRRSIVIEDRNVFQTTYYTQISPQEHLVGHMEAKLVIAHEGDFARHKHWIIGWSISTDGPPFIDLELYVNRRMLEALRSGRGSTKAMLIKFMNVTKLRRVRVYTLKDPWHRKTWRPKGIKTMILDWKRENGP